MNRLLSIALWWRLSFGRWSCGAEGVSVTSRAGLPPDIFLGDCPLSVSCRYLFPWELQEMGSVSVPGTLQLIPHLRRSETSLSVGRVGRNVC